MVLAGWHTYDHYAYALIAVLGTAAAVVGTQWFIQRSRWSAWAHSLQGVVPPFINILGGVVWLDAGLFGQRHLERPRPSHTGRLPRGRCLAKPGHLGFANA